MRWCCGWKPLKAPVIPVVKSQDERARKVYGAMGSPGRAFERKPYGQVCDFEMVRVVQHEGQRAGQR